jgi:hypothetical protein
MRFWSHAPNFLESEAQAVVPSPQMRAARLAELDRGNAGWQREPSVSHDKVGDVLVAQGRLDAALEAYCTARVILQNLLLEIPGHPVWRADLERLESSIAGCEAAG